MNRVKNPDIAFEEASRLNQNYPLFQNIARLLTPELINQFNRYALSRGFTGAILDLDTMKSLSDINSCIDNELKYKDLLEKTISKFSFVVDRMKTSSTSESFWRIWSELNYVRSVLFPTKQEA